MQPSDDYTAQATQRCERVLGTLMRGVGQPWRDRMCLIGGLVPRYLLPMSGYRQPGHVGSTDVDLALSVALGDCDEGAYATLASNLKRLGLKRFDASSWRWFADVEGLPTVVEFIGDDAGAEAGSIFTPRIRPAAGAGGVGLLCVRGIDLCFADSLVVDRTVELLDGTVSDVRFRLPNVEPFLALKADAFLDRNKPKDAYDLVYVVRWWQGGPEAAADSVSASPVFRETFVQDALARVKKDFATPHRLGAVQYARLAAGRASSEDLALHANEAVAAMGSFFASLPM